MKTKMKYLIFAVSISWMSSALAYNHDFVKPKGGGDLTPKAGCAPSNERLTMNFNDVSALLETGGMLFLNRASGVAAYEVPKGGGVTAIYAGSLWMGGTDSQGQLRLAAALFRQGNDFTSGPLGGLVNAGDYDPSQPVADNATRPYGGASVSANECLAYDKFFTIRKAEVIAYNTWWECEFVDPCDEIIEISSELQNRINKWPAHGDVSLGEDPFLAPFYDRDPDGAGPEGPNGIYQPLEDGDYPWYDDILGRNDIVCGDDRRVSLFGDETHWWVFNDKGSIHTESGGEPIGMEIRAQAFTFTTNDEVNRMTFYNYEMINRSTYELIDTYFAQYVDADLGGSPDDYVGCDVTRGLGYAFNGDNFDDDANGKPGYGPNPPAIGIDFFEGPYQNADGRDNILATGPQAVQDALADSGIVYPGLGVGYGDSIIDNERYGMRRFNYYTGTAAPNQSDPSAATQFYNYMSGFWRFGDEMVYGGTGFPGSPGSTNINSSYMFPGDSDTLNWGTAGIDPGFAGGDWSEVTANNAKGDRRFVQSAGPFTLRPGAVNNITVGIVYARSTDSDLFASVRSLKRADTKAQALFDNCFKILDPPPAPVLTVQELENEVILMLSNPVGKNKNEAYEEIDEINIPESFTDRSYRFEGYQIYQMVDEDASAADIGDVDKARLVAQCDIKNDVPNKLINFEYDESLNLSIPVEKVNAGNQGIRHSFRITEDQFAQGSRTLVNHKSYYFIAIAYAYNRFKEYDPNDPTKLDGQKIPYISSRNNGDGTAISSKLAIPHSIQPEAGGTIQNVGYGATPQITRLDGRGNGNRSLELTSASTDYIVENGFMETPTYDYGSGPLNIKVVDPLNLANGYFVCKFTDYTPIANQANNSNNNTGVDIAKWTIYRYSDASQNNLLDQVSSERTINSSNEQIIAKWGVSVQIFQEQYYFNGTTGNEYIRFTDPIESSIEFTDSSKRWLTTITDNDGILPENWIRSGNFKPNAASECNDALGIYNPCCYNDELNINDPIDPDKKYAKLLSGGIAPYRLVGYQCAFMPLAYPSFYTSFTTSRERNSISRAPSIDIVITNDKTKWTRCAVIELGRDENLNVGGAKPGTLRKSTSRDQDGNPIAGSTGMSWFPGYAIDLETGARLHMAFGENSYLSSENGSDMLWNPTSRRYDNQGNPLFGGQHPIYVYGVNLLGNPDATKNAPYYDGVNNWVYDKMQVETAASYADVYSSLTWIANTILAPGQDLRSTDVKIRVRINKEYNDFTATGDNGGKPMYAWSMDGISTTTGVKDQLADALKLINIVPNPYYAFSQYERGRLDTRVKITNLPEKCTVKIYNVSGKLIRAYKKDSQITSLDWDMKNGKGIPIASGVYLIHVEVPDVGDVVLKFFGGVRAVDLENI
jgi:hypothetical protein